MAKRSKRQQPSDPRDVAANLERAEAKREVARLEAIGAESWLSHEEQEDGRMKWVARGRRIDVFKLLLERNALPQESFNAVREYEVAVATACGFNTPERRPDHIRSSQSGPPGQNIGDMQIDASRTVAWVERSLTTRDHKLLTALLRENDANVGRWRGTVEVITGETRDECHAAAIRCMAANLKDVMDREPPRSPAVQMAA